MAGAYDPSKDLLLWESPMSPANTTVQVRSYNNGEPKIKFMKTFVKNNGETNTNPAYGLTLEDISYMGGFWDQLKAVVYQFKNGSNNQQQPVQNQSPSYQPGYNPMHQ